jgi:hypothetical protein
MEEEECNLQEGGKFIWIEDLLYERPWVEELVYLVQNSASKFRRLRKITVLDWNSSIDWPGKECNAARRLTGIWRLRAESRIPFLMLKETSQWQTPVPYFLEILQTRNPGCGDWRGAKRGTGRRSFLDKFITYSIVRLRSLMRALTSCPRLHQKRFVRKPPFFSHTSPIAFPVYKTRKS